MFYYKGSEVCYVYQRDLIQYEQAYVYVLYDVGSCNAYKTTGDSFNDENYVATVTNDFCCSKQNNYMQSYKCSR